MITVNAILHTTGGAIAILLIAVALYCIGVFILDELALARQRRIARIEAELDAKSEQLRRTILNLAEQLAAERDEVSRKLTEQAFLASGKTTPSP